MVSHFIALTSAASFSSQISYHSWAVQDDPAGCPHPNASYLLESRFTVYTCPIIEVSATRTVVSAVCLTITA